MKNSLNTKKNIMLVLLICIIVAIATASSFLFASANAEEVEAPNENTLKFTVSPEYSFEKGTRPKIYAYEVDSDYKVLSKTEGNPDVVIDWENDGTNTTRTMFASLQAKTNLSLLGVFGMNEATIKHRVLFSTSEFPKDQVLDVNKAIKYQSYFNASQYGNGNLKELSVNAASVRLYVDLNGGSITSAQEEYLTNEERGWSKDSSTGVWYKDVEPGIPIQSAMEAWKDISPTRDDEQFSGFNPPIKGTAAVVEGITTFTAVYGASCIATVDLNGGTITDLEKRRILNAGWTENFSGNYEKTIDKGTTRSEAMSAWNGISPTKDDLSFSAWDPTVDSTPIDSDITFTAEYSSAPTQYIVTVDLAGGALSNDDDATITQDGWEKTENSNQILYKKKFDVYSTYSTIMSAWNSVTPLKDDYNFNGWNPKPDNTPLTADTTFSALYQKAQYLVTVDLAGGSITSSEIDIVKAAGWSESSGKYQMNWEATYSYGQIMSAWKNVTPKKDNYTFSNWDPYPSSQQLTSPTTFTAIYELVPPPPIKYHDVFVSIEGGWLTEDQEAMLFADGWEASNAQSSTYKKTVAEGTSYSDVMSIWKNVIPTPENDDYEFVGWDPEPGSQEISSDTTFKAIFKLIEPVPPTPPDPGTDPEYVNSDSADSAQTGDNVPISAILIVGLIAAGMFTVSRKNIQR